MISNPSIAGLQGAGPQAQSPQGSGFSPSSDPLGIGLQARGRANRIATQTANPATQVGPLPSPEWEGMLQALHEQGVQGLAGGPSPTLLAGNDPATPPLQSTAFAGTPTTFGSAGGEEFAGNKEGDPRLRQAFSGLQAYKPSYTGS